MKTTASNKKLRQFLNSIRSGELIPSPDFQRRLVWNNKHKIAFIRTVLDGYPFPEIYVAAGAVNPDTGAATEFLVDGQQRMTTLYQYFVGSEDIDLGGEIPPFRELQDEQKTNFLQYDVVWRDLGIVPRETILEVFTRINSTNYALLPMEIHNARYDGALKQFAQRIAELSFFEEHRTFTATDIRRMNDLRYVLWIIISIVSTYFNRDDELENYLKEYNNSFPLEVEVDAGLQTVFSFIDACEFDDKSRVWKKADLFTLIVELHRAIVKNGMRLKPAATANRLKKFYDKVDSVDPDQPQKRPGAHYKYYFAALQASNDRGSRITRGEIIETVLRRNT
jgi:hypothetical protein